MRFVTIAEQPDLADRLGPLIDSIWPEYMLQDPVGNAHWPRLFSDFPENQFVLLDGDELIGTANSIPAIDVDVSTSLGRTSLQPGTTSTSSKVSASDPESTSSFIVPR